MKLKLEKDFRPLSFDIVTHDEIAKNRKLEEDKARKEKARKDRLERRRIANLKKAEEEANKFKERLFGYIISGVLIILFIILSLVNS